MADIVSATERTSSGSVVQVAAATKTADPVREAVRIEVQRAMQEAGLTQYRLAKIIGVQSPAVSMWLSGESGIAQGRVYAVDAACGLAMGTIYARAGKHLEQGDVTCGYPLLAA